MCVCHAPMSVGDMCPRNGSLYLSARLFCSNGSLYLGTSLSLSGSLYTGNSSGFRWDLDDLIKGEPLYKRLAPLWQHLLSQRMDIDAPMNELPDDSEPEPDLVSDDEDGEDAIIVRDTGGIVVHMEEELDVAKLSDEELLELLAGASEAADPSGEVEDTVCEQEGDAAPPAKKPKMLGQRWSHPPKKLLKGRPGMAVWS